MNPLKRSAGVNVHKYSSLVEVADSDKHSSLLQYGIAYSRKAFNNASHWEFNENFCLYYKTSYPIWGDKLACF